MPETNGNNVANVTTGKPKVGGAVYRAPAGTAAPTDAKTDLPSAFKCMGYVSDEGVTNANTRETEEIKAWGGDTVANPQTSKTDTLQMTLIEFMNVEALKAYFGDKNVSGTLETGIHIKSNSGELERAVWVVEMIAAGGYPHRYVIPDGKVTETEDISYVDNDVAGLGLTITAYPDANGDTHHQYIGGTAD